MLDGGDPQQQCEIHGQHMKSITLSKMLKDFFKTNSGCVVSNQCCRKATMVNEKVPEALFIITLYC